MPALRAAPVSPSGSDPAPCEKHSQSSNDRVDGCHHLVKRRHLDLEPIDQSGSDERNDPGGDERRESPVEKCSPMPGLQRLGDCHALMYPRDGAIVREKSRRKIRLSGDFVVFSASAWTKKLTVVPQIPQVAPAALIFLI